MVLPHYQWRQRQRAALCMLVLILAGISCLHNSQVLGVRQLRYDDHQLLERSTEVSHHEQHDQVMYNDEIYNSRNSSYTSHEFEGSVADSERAVPTGPDPLHNREEKT
ncbi:unnamed protein product [Amaranthus hypochondriacus]